MALGDVEYTANNYLLFSQLGGTRSPEEFTIQPTNGPCRYDPTKAYEFTEADLDPTGLTLWRQPIDVFQDY
jgi:hypothetical protein